MENKNLFKAIAICCLFMFVFSYFFSGLFQSGGDYNQHFYKAKNGCEGSETIGWSEDACEIYAPLFHTIAQPFTYHENAFFYFVLLLLGLVTPLIVFWFTKEWISVILYFTTTVYFYFNIDGFFPQALAGIILLLIFLVRDWRIQVALVGLSIFAHGHAFLLCLIGFGLINFKKGFLNNKFLGCSSTFGANKPEVFDTPIQGLVTTGVQFKLSHVLVFFARIFPLPFLICSIWYSINKKYKIDLLLMACFCFIAGFTVSHRAFYFIPLLLIPSLTMFAVGLKGKPRILFWLVVLVSFVYLFGGWINFKNCLTSFG